MLRRWRGVASRPWMRRPAFSPCAPSVLTTRRDDAIAPAALGVIQGGVGPGEQLSVAALARGHTDRDGHNAPVAGRMGHGHRLDRGADPLGRRPRLGRRGARQYEQQLLAPEPVGAVVGPQRPADGPGDRPQRLIAGQVAHLVVVGLEVIDVAQRHRQGSPQLPVAGLDLRQLVGQGAPVAHAGQGVAAGVLEQLLVEPGQLHLAIGEPGQRRALAPEQPAQPALEQAAPKRQRQPREQETQEEREAGRLRLIEQIGAHEGGQEHKEQDGRQDPAPQTRLLGGGVWLGHPCRQRATDADGERARAPISDRLRSGPGGSAPRGAARST